MKKSIFIASTLALSITTAHADVTVDQTGVGHSANVTQGGSAASTTIDQSGTGAHTAEINEQGASALFVIDVTQIGDGASNSAIISQGIAPPAESSVILTQEGSGLSANITLEGSTVATSDANSVNVIQAGDDNSVLVDATNTGALALTAEQEATTLNNSIDFTATDVSLATVDLAQRGTTSDSSINLTLTGGSSTEFGSYAITQTDCASCSSTVVGYFNP